MDPFLFVVLITAIAGVGGTGLGGLIGVLFTRNSEKLVSLLLSFAGGVMLCIVCLDLLSGALGQAPGSVGNVFLVIGMTVVGFGVVYFLNAVIDKKTNPEVKHIDKKHPKTADQLSELIHSDHYEEHKKEYEQTGQQKSRRQLFLAGLVVAFAIALHNFPEGMVIGASYASDLASGGVGSLAVAIVIGLHNVPEGMSVAVPLAAGGMKKMEGNAHHGRDGRAHDPGRNARLLPGHPQSRQPRHFPELCKRRDAVCRLRRAASGIHSDVALQGARHRNARRAFGGSAHSVCMNTGAFLHGQSAKNALQTDKEQV